MSDAESKDLYKILGVDPKASTEEIKRSYFRLAKVLHPDRNSLPDATDKFRQIIEAYNVLVDPQKRLLYDDYGIEVFKKNLVHFAISRPWRMFLWGLFCVVWYFSRLIDRYLKTRIVWFIFVFYYVVECYFCEKNMMLLWNCLTLGITSAVLYLLVPGGWLAAISTMATLTNVVFILSAFVPEIDTSVLVLALLGGAEFYNRTPQPPKFIYIAAVSLIINTIFIIHHMKNLSSKNVAPVDKQSWLYKNWNPFPLLAVVILGICWSVDAFIFLLVPSHFSRWTFPSFWVLFCFYTGLISRASRQAVNTHITTIWLPMLVCGWIINYAISPKSALLLLSVVQYALVLWFARIYELLRTHTAGPKVGYFLLFALLSAWEVYSNNTLGEEWRHFVGALFGASLAASTYMATLHRHI
ncbi:uncharacterized protein LOC126318361 [Schistocerca gregaria]|uniref:uncharacterized protein LOC126318361 n=1 Tax=Schistocerca gregaria TaxID=7010 RepID=UPI00211E0893|nr:uncharacterized protein LOC126318361 [Schistocerca gregaria]